MPETPTATIAAWPALLDDHTAAAYLSISRTTFWQLVSKKEIPAPIKVPTIRASRWRREDIDAVIAGWAEGGVKS